ncbi:MAG: AAA family ATPase [Oscillospiraceae bacterium]
MGQVLAVISGKGGTGKTSVCAGVAGCLCMEGARVLCIDADLGLRNLDISLGMASEAGLSFLDVMRGDYAIEQAPRAAGLPGLQLLTAPVSVKADEIDRGAFEALIHDAKERYDWVLIDAPAGVGAGFELAIRFADELRGRVSGGPRVPARCGAGCRASPYPGGTFRRGSLSTA